MSSYIDVETSAEAILEDEELIEAVEALVETAAVSVWTSILQDINDVHAQVRRIVEVLFPILVDWEKDPNVMREDMEKAAIAILLFVAAFVIFAPWKKKTSRSSKHFLLRKVRSDSWSSSHHSSSHSYASEDRSDDEADEERFDKLWPSISMSRYRKLVLPPTCRLVEKPKKAKKEKEATATAAAKQVAEEKQEENPAARLQTYVSQFLFLLKSIISFDLARAGWTILFWLRGIRRRRRTVSVDQLHAVDSDPQGDTDVLHARPASAPSTPTRSLSLTSLSSQQQHTHAGAINHSHDEEEKKETSDSCLVSPPRLPSLKLERVKSESSMYFDGHDGGDDSKAFSTPKSPAGRLLKKLSVKRRDALQAYRNNDHSETTTATTPSVGKQSLTAPSLESTTSEATTGGNDPALTPREQALAFQHSDALTANSAESFFFETAHSQDTLKKLSIEVPVPDKNGYILGDDFLVDSRYTPLLVFVNSRSGPQQGQLLITQMRRLLNPIQVWDLSEGGPETILESFLVLTRLRILVCGGDGTVSWIVSTLEKMKLDRKWPPIAILPLGTGNDLARIHGWGGGYNNESLITILEQVQESYISLLDRWEVTIDGKQAKKKEVKTFFNYLGVGADAQAALQVHYLRESKPQWFFSRLVNKAWYGVFGAEDMIMAASVNVRKEIKLVADGCEVTLPSDSQGIIVLNIDSYAGGVPLWSHGTKASHVNIRNLKSPRRSQSMHAGLHQAALRSNSIDRVDSLDDLNLVLSDEERFDRVTACDRPSSCQDGVLEIVSIRGAFHLGQIKVGLSNAQRLCQCREVTITIKNKVAVQIDGEPWRQKPCTIHIQRKPEHAVMLHRSSDDGGVETEMSKLLDWAEERQLIDSEVHSILMKEFSRRIESKTRKRRVREQDNIMKTLKKAISQTAMSNMQSSGPSNWHGGIAF